MSRRISLLLVIAGLLIIPDSAAYAAVMDKEPSPAHIWASCLLASGLSFVLTRFRWWLVLTRHIRAAFLAGLLLTREASDHPRKALRALWPYWASSLLAAAAALTLFVFLIARRRLRLLLLLLVPILGAFALLIVAEGHAFLRSHPLWWRLIDHSPWGG